jgi:hypothetical protein
VCGDGGNQTCDGASYHIFYAAHTIFDPLLVSPKKDLYTGGYNPVACLVFCSFHPSFRLLFGPCILPSMITRRAC